MKRYILRWAMLAAILVLAYSGCNLGTSIEARVEQFLDDLNTTNYDAIYLNFHPTLTSDYDAIKNVEWDSLFPPDYIPYSIPDLDTSDAGSVTGNISSSNDLTWSGPKVVVFRMAKDGLNWMIQGMDFDIAFPLIE